jgi:hypothetical protein
MSRRKIDGSIEEAAPKPPKTVSATTKRAIVTIDGLPDSDDRIRVVRALAALYIPQLGVTREA